MFFGRFDEFTPVCYSEIDNDRRPTRILALVNLTSCGLRSRPAGLAPCFAVRVFPTLEERLGISVYPRMISFSPDDPPSHLIASRGGLSTAVLSSAVFSA